MNISGIRPVSDYSRSFGVYDVAKLHKPTAGDITVVGKSALIHSQSQVNQAVDIMKRDSSLYKYNKFLGVKADTTPVLRPEMENFNL